MKPAGRYRPPHSSMISAIVLASSPAMMRMFFRPSRTTCTTWESFTDSRLQKGGITFCSTRNSTYTNPHIHTTSILDYTTQVHGYKCGTGLVIQTYINFSWNSEVNVCLLNHGILYEWLISVFCVKIKTQQAFKQAPGFFIAGPKEQLTWSFLPLMVRLLMAHAASFCVPKSPCGETDCHWDALI